jgi:hypothetical protein
MLNIQDNQKQFNRELIIKASRTEKQYWKDLWNYRELFYFLAWRDILVRYKQTATGMAWAVRRPFLTMLVLKIIFGKLANEFNISAISEREKLNQRTKTKPLSSKKSGQQLFYKEFESKLKACPHILIGEAR